MPPTDYGPQVAVATPALVWIRAIVSRIRHRKAPDAVEGHRVVGLK